MAQIKKEIWNGKEVYCLEHGKVTARVNPADGMNIYQLIYDGKLVTAWDEGRFERKATYGIPVLYPTPNRSANGKIQIGEKIFDATMHGLVKNLPYEVTEMQVLSDKVCLTGTLTWDENQPDFARFPYVSKLLISVEVREESAVWSYEVINEGDEPLSYGIAIHPFFSKREQQVSITVPAHSVMEMTEEKIPTGRLLAVEGTEFDLETPKSVADLNLDHVYTDREVGKKENIYYEDMHVELKASDEFTHVVVFTPETDFFCIENQSCSTDCFNLHKKGFEKEAGLETVAVNDSKKGFIEFCFNTKKSSGSS
jgi:aldose 1-epimerase